MAIADYIKVSGKLEDIRVFEHKEGSVRVIMKIDGVLIPNTDIPIKLYEEIEAGKHYDFYCVYKKSRNKLKNSGAVYAFKEEGGRIRSLTKLRLATPVYMMFYGAIWFAVAYVAVFILALLPVLADHPRTGALPILHSYSMMGGAIPGLFFLWCAIDFWRKSANLEAWPSVAPSVVIERFSKLHK
ncbi:hypothetical protein [Pseudomonas monteilii]|uniref:hypothetical protein n=1 Tax=Pseudomonas monteilii TaxID=76759 RepID=UPI001E379172|nr:hypothetical protein [Pseudomonas monteilii]MCE0877171.1 hypothetical protein [Pseudomonas monteilii]MCE0929327.1 hypothetical protein [Pseudomonas monteilii]MCE0935068.1 hypothetical protein [Pseudomonas monteilii]MCE1015601.1 hypothetical protein [Pseudomonas monteilii]MCE1044298.1 hypothetical protein [Pseudomonas monteilii]